MGIPQVTVPRIRFTGKGQGWKKCKLDELAIFNPSSQVPDVFEYVDLESVVGTEMISHREESKATAPSRAQRLAQKGDLFYQTVRPYQKNNHLFELEGNFVFSTGYAQLRPHGDGYYLLALLQSESFIRVVLNSCTGTSYPAINPSVLANIPVACSEDSVEQASIGSFFRALDSFIIQQQRKYDRLVNIKKALLGKMFPKEGETVPEIRFAGCAGEWMHSTLDELVTEFPNPVQTPKDGYWRLGIRSHAKGTFHAYVPPGKELGTGQMHRVEENNLIVNITFAWEHAVAITESSDSGKLVSHRFPQFSFNADMYPPFFKYVIGNEKFRHCLLLSSPGSAGRNRVLKTDEMLKYDTVVPGKEEQERITHLLETLEKSITLNASKLDKLKQLKQAFLERMFV